MDVSDIFYFFSARGRGRGVQRAAGGGGGEGTVFIENPRGGSGFQEGPRGREGICSELGNFGGRGLNIFFRGRNVHQDKVILTKMVVLTISDHFGPVPQGPSHIKHTAVILIRYGGGKKIRR